MTNKVREIKWPEEFSDLKRIEGEMICGICYEYMETCVMTPCSHNYCSLCIRKYLHFKSQCPSCFTEFFEKDLHTNRSLDLIIQYFLSVRKKLFDIMQNNVVSNHFEITQNNLISNISEEIKTPQKMMSMKSEILSTSMQTPITEKPSCSKSTPKSLSLSAKKLITSPSTSLAVSPKSNIAKIFSSPKVKKEPLLIINTNTVSCPICSVNVPEPHINKHLDACLKREDAIKTNDNKKFESLVPKRRPMPKLVLRVMKDAELRKKMKEFGLPTNGDRKTLENRFTRYSTIYNAECDKFNPRPVSELIRQCEEEETLERKMDSFLVSNATSTVRLQIQRNAAEKDIEQAQKKYLEANKSDFDKLIEEVRNRKIMEKNQEKKENSKENSKENNSFKSELQIQKKSKLKNNTSFQDSDSDTSESYVLQHYKSDDPASIQAINNLSLSPCTSNSNSPMKRSARLIVSSTNKAKELLKTQDDVYNEETDAVSSDDDIPNSPELNKKRMNKRLRLSKNLFKNNILKDDPEEFLEKKQQENKEEKARELCNGIINDFSLSNDENSSEFEHKKEKQFEVVEKVRNSDLDVTITDPTSAEALVLTDQKNFLGETKSCNSSVLLDKSYISNSNESIKQDLVLKQNGNLDETLSLSNTASLSKSLSNLSNFSDLSTKDEDFTISKEASVFSSDSLADFQVANTMTLGKENHSINKKDSENLIESGRTTRRQTRAKRLINENSETDKIKCLKENNITTENSLKRRRGRSKANSVDLSEELPATKRPVRRRLKASEIDQ